MTNSLNTILKEIKEKKAIVNADLDLNSPTARNMRDRQNSAKIRIEQLQVDYRNALLNQTVFIIMYGADAEKMAKVAEKDFGSYAVNAETLFDRIANEVPANVYAGKNASPSLFDIISHALEGVAAEAGVTSFPQPIFRNSKHGRVLGSKADLTTLIKQVISEDVGSELIAVHAVTATFLKALDNEFNGRVYPVVLHTSDAQYAARLNEDINKRLQRQTFTVAVGADPISGSTLLIEKATKVALKEALTQIKTQLGGK
jgi:hypothetical protein